MAPAMRFSRLMLGRVYLISLLIACKESDATVHASNPDASHTARLAPMLCVFATMIPGEELRGIVSFIGKRKPIIQYSGANLVQGSLMNQFG